MRIGRTLAPAAVPIPLSDLAASIGRCTDKKQIARFSYELKEFFGVQHCFLVSSGKAALFLILKALKAVHPEKNEVLIPAFTCYSVPSAIKKAGLKIRLCDVNPDTLDFDFDKLDDFFRQNDLSPSPAQGHAKILCVLPTHLFGIPADVEKLSKITRGKVTIVEDAAQAMGAEDQGKKFGTLGDVGFYSLGRGKAFTTLEGGVILTNRSDIARQLKATIGDLPEYSQKEICRLICQSILLAVFLRPWLYWLPNSLPFLNLGETFFEHDFPVKKLSPFQAALAKNWQAKLNVLQQRRRVNANYYLEKLSSGIQHVRRVQNQSLPDVIRFPFLTQSSEVRDRIVELGKKAGLGIMPSYPDSIDGIKELQEELKGQQYPGAKLLSKRLITLPVHPYVNPSETRRILDLIQSLEKTTT
ncbi:MAG: DegT/DnrJ/EryC1/StrS family aminotransferase [Lascolabacillus sp.]|nr:DegT/DnrJ/EryC1/StrS family aminotransferase [Lascolabacillus sp.]